MLFWGFMSAQLYGHLVPDTELLGNCQPLPINFWWMGIKSSIFHPHLVCVISHKNIQYRNACHWRRIPWAVCDDQHIMISEPNHCLSAHSFLSLCVYIFTNCYLPPYEYIVLFSKLLYFYWLFLLYKSVKTENNILIIHILFHFQRLDTLLLKKKELT